MEDPGLQKVKEWIEQELANDDPQVKEFVRQLNYNYPDLQKIDKKSWMAFWHSDAISETLKLAAEILVRVLK